MFKYLYVVYVLYMYSKTIVIFNLYIFFLFFMQSCMHCVNLLLMKNSFKFELKNSLKLYKILHDTK